MTDTVERTGSVVEGDRVRHDIRLPIDLWKLLRYGVVSADIREDHCLGFRVGDVVAYRNDTDDRVTEFVITWVSNPSGLLPGWVMLSFGLCNTCSRDCDTRGAKRHRPVR